MERWRWQTKNIYFYLSRREPTETQKRILSVDWTLNISFIFLFSKEILDERVAGRTFRSFFFPPLFQASKPPENMPWFLTVKKWSRRKSRANHQNNQRDNCIHYYIYFSLSVVGRKEEEETMMKGTWDGGRGVRERDGLKNRGHFFELKW